MSPHNAGSESRHSLHEVSLQRRWLGRVLLLAAVAVALTAMLLSNPNESSAATSNGWTTMATISPSSVRVGDTATFTVSVTSSTNTSAIVDLEVYTPSGRSLQKAWPSQAFVAGKPLLFTTTWVVPANEPLTTHTAKVGVFRPNWSRLLHWNDSAKTFSIGASGSTTTTTTAPTTPGGSGHFATLPVGAALPSDATCASQVRHTPEVRPSNATFNATKGTPGSATGIYARVTGNFTGTTDELIQWASCKWGIDEDIVRAQVAVESWWHQNAAGDFTSDSSKCVPGHAMGADGHAGMCPESIGLLQLRYQYMRAAFPSATNSSAYNLDYSLAARRSCFEGYETWLNTVDRGRTYSAGDLWGCVGMWFSGRWYVPGGVNYTTTVQKYLAQRIWETPDFQADGDSTTTPPPTTTTTTTAAPTTTTTTTTTTTAPPGGPAPTPTPPAGSTSSFSDSFATAAAGGSRNGALSPTDYSVSRWRQEGPSGNGDGSASNIRPQGGPAIPGDVTINNGVLRLDTSVQNYGDTSVRLNRVLNLSQTTTIEFDTNLGQGDIGLKGWQWVRLDDLPYSSLSYLGDNAGGPIPDTGILVAFSMRDGTPYIRTWKGSVQTDDSHADGVPATGGMVHIKIVVTGTNMSVCAGSLCWSFKVPAMTTAHLTFGGHNHATNKYYNVPTATTLWDNLSVTGSLSPEATSQVANSGTNVFGWVLTNTAGPTLTFPAVPANPTSARLLLNLWATQCCQTGRTLLYSLNGGPTHTIAVEQVDDRSGAHALSLPVTLSELVAGSNTVRFWGASIFSMGTPYYANVDLVTTAGRTDVPPSGPAANPPPPQATTTTSTTTTTTTTAPPSPPAAPSGPTNCGIVNAAFCDTFDAPHNGGTQTGDLDPLVWGVSRLADINPSSIVNGFVMSHNACANGATSPIPSDIRVCNGQMVASMNDGGSVTNVDTYPKQPFNFAGRTGKVVFDVSADSDGTHAAWPEFVITDEPVPGTRRCIQTCPGYTLIGRNEIGFSLADSAPGPGTTGVDNIFAAVNGSYSSMPMTTYGSITKGSGKAMNHIEVQVSQTRIDIYGTDAGSTVLKHLAGANLNLAFSQGLVWLNSTHYNARKAIEPCECGTQFDHSFFWDNLGFDGPKTYRDWGYDVPYANNQVAGKTSQHGDTEYVQEGYVVGNGPKNLTVSGVDKGVATGAKVVVNAYSFSGTSISVSVNGHTAVSHAISEQFSWNSFSFAVPVSDVVAGNNTLTFTSNDGSTTVANVSLIMVAAGPVP